MIWNGVKAVNTLSNCQIVIFLGGGVGNFEVKIHFFKWWYLKDFSPTILTILNSPCIVIKKLSKGVWGYKDE